MRLAELSTANRCGRCGDRVRPGGDIHRVHFTCFLGPHGPDKPERTRFVAPVRSLTSPCTICEEMPAGDERTVAALFCLDCFRYLQGTVVSGHKVQCLSCRRPMRAARGQSFWVHLQEPCWPSDLTKTGSVFTATSEGTCSICAVPNPAADTLAVVCRWCAPTPAAGRARLRRASPAGIARPATRSASPKTSSPKPKPKQRPKPSPRRPATRPVPPSAGESLRSEPTWTRTRSTPYPSRDWRNPVWSDSRTRIPSAPPAGNRIQSCSACGRPISPNGRCGCS
jgi:hypothetical protein